MIAGIVPLAVDTFPTSGIAAAAAVAVLPIIVIAGTAFIKISVVLAILRSALGAPGVPPTVVLTALSAVLTMFVMAPVANDMVDALEASAESEALTGEENGIAEAKRLYHAASPPLLDFLAENAAEREVVFFQGLAGEGKDARGFRILLPAFAVGEIAEAFLMGFLLFVPFLVVDLIVAMVLAALGMPMLSPTAVSLPLKLLLFVAVDGWQVILSGLLVKYSA